MINFNIKKLPYDLSSHAGLTLVGKYLRRIKRDRVVDAQFPVRSGLPNSAVIKSFLALLCTGKNDFNAIETFRGDSFFKRALGLDAVPSIPTMRQRMDTHAQSWFDLVWELNRAVLDLRVNGRRTDFGALECGYIPVDIDSFVMDNSGTKKELIGRSYTGVDGYCPLAAYIGTSGYCLALSLRPGTQHSARETDNDLEHLLPMATSVAAGPLLLRCDSGFFAETDADRDIGGGQVRARDRLSDQMEPARNARRIDRHRQGG